MPCVGAVVSQEMIAPAVMAAVPVVFTDARPLGISESVGRRFFFFIMSFLRFTFPGFLLAPFYFSLSLRSPLSAVLHWSPNFSFDFSFACFNPLEKFWQDNLSILEACRAVEAQYSCDSGHCDEET